MAEKKIGFYKRFCEWLLFFEALRVVLSRRLRGGLLFGM
jgi:hypothetical protein